MKAHLPLLVLLALCCNAFGQSPAASPAPKIRNVVFFLVDDLGQRDIGPYGSTFYETPNLDRLAKEGTLYSDAYAACPVCSPSRASILTGKWPQRTGITDYIGAVAKPDQWKRNTRSLPAPFAERLELDEPTLAKALKAKDFGTFFAGKWHLGPQGFWPENQGFDINKGGIDRGGPYGGKKYFSPYENPRLSDGPDGEHLTDRLANETNSFMEANKDKPFLAYYSFYDVHTPLMARPDLKAKYEAKRKKLGLEEKWGREEPRDVRLSQDHVVYAAMVEAMDQAVGKVLAKVDALGLREQTLVVFTSDNGGLSTSEGWPTSNAPLRGGKGWMYEGGIRVPLIVRWPGVTKPGTVVSAPVSGPDHLPTLLDAVGAPIPAGQVADGVSLRASASGGNVPERPLFWHYPHYGNQGAAPAAAVRRGDWKLIEWQEDGRLELFNLSQDISETNNLAAKEPERAAKLRDELHGWQKQVGAKSPTANPKFDSAGPDGRGSVRKK